MILTPLQLNRLIEPALYPENMSENATEFDSPWKDALDYYSEDFMLLFFPQAHSEISWSQGYEFLDKELQQVVRDAELDGGW